MIVCICNAIRERDIREAARLGLTDASQIYQALGCEPNCRQCLRFANQIVANEVRAVVISGAPLFVREPVAGHRVRA